jgi:hypothetical protein
MALLRRSRCAGFAGLCTHLRTVSAEPLPKVLDRNFLRIGFPPALQQSGILADEGINAVLRGGRMFICHHWLKKFDSGKAVRAHRDKDRNNDRVVRDGKLRETGWETTFLSKKMQGEPLRSLKPVAEKMDSSPFAKRAIRQKKRSRGKFPVDFHNLKRIRSLKSNTFHEIALFKG